MRFRILFILFVFFAGAAVPLAAKDSSKAREPKPKDDEEEHETDSRYGGLKQLGASFIRDANNSNSFSKLSRYETALQRSLQRDLHELERLQARRQGGDVQTPVAIDVTIDGPSPSAEDKP